LPLQQDYYVRDGGVIVIQALGSFRLQANALNSQTEQIGHVLAHAQGMGTNPGSIDDDSRVHLYDSVAGFCDQPQSSLQKNGGVSALPLWIGGREKRADIGSGNGAEQGVGESVQQNVSVGVAAEALVVRQFETADSKRDAGLEGVRVPAITDAGGEFGVGFQSFKVSRFQVCGFRFSRTRSSKSAMKEVYFLK
jgi:hypothetical protein